MTDLSRTKYAGSTPGPWTMKTGPYGWDRGLFPASARPDWNNGIMVNSGRGSGDAVADDEHLLADAPALAGLLAELCELDQTGYGPVAQQRLAVALQELMARAREQIGYREAP